MVDSIDIEGPDSLKSFFNSSIGSIVKLDDNLVISTQAGVVESTYQIRNPDSEFSTSLVRMGSFDTDYRDVLIKDWYRPGSPNVKLPDPSTVPSGSSGSGTFMSCVAWSPDGVYCTFGGFEVLAGNVGKIYCYKRSGDVFTPLAVFPFTASFAGSGGKVNCLAWSPDGKYLAVGVTLGSGAGTNSYFIYQRTGDSFSLVYSGSNSTVGNVFCIAWAPDGKTLAAGGDNSTLALVILLPNGTFQPWTILSGTPSVDVSYIRSIMWAPNGQYLALGGDTTNQTGNPQYRIFEKDDLFFRTSPLPYDSIPSGLLYGSAMGVGWSSDSQYVTFSFTGAGQPFLVTYRRSGSRLTLMPDPAGYITSESAPSMCWSPDNKYVFVGITSTPYVMVYKHVDGQLTYVPAMSTNISGQVNGVAISPDAKHLAVASSDAPYVRFYKSNMGPITGLAVHPTPIQ